MPLFTTKTNRCSLCYALLSSHTTSSTLGYSSLSSLNKRCSNHCSISTIQRLISSSIKFDRLWRQNENGAINSRLFCFRCCETIRQIEQIQADIEQLSNNKDKLLNKLEHTLLKRAMILQGQRQRINNIHINHQQIPLYDDDEDTEEGEEKPRTVITTNGNGYSSSLAIPTTTLVGAKRRKSTVAHKINVDDKSADPSSFNNFGRSTSPKSDSNQKLPSNFPFGSHLHKHRTNSMLPAGLNGHDLSNLAFSSTFKSLALPTLPSTTTAPFLDPTTGALIAIVSNPHHAALLAQQHQQILKSSSISPSSTNTNDEHEIVPMAKPQHQKKFPCLLCGRDFSNKSNLNRHHSIVHVAIRNFECARCPKKFKLRQGLKTHMQRCHGVNTDEPTFVLQKHHLQNYHHNHHHPSSSSFIAQTNK